MKTLELNRLLLRALYIEDATALSGVILDGLQEDILAAVNRTYQTLWTAPQDHFRRSQFSFVTEAAEDAYTLAAGVQEIFGEVSIDNTPPHLRPIKAIGDFLNYPTRFLGAASNTIANGRPVAYHVTATGAAAAEATVLTMYLKPTPDAVYTVRYDASTEAPTLEQDDIDDDIDLHVPAKYVESIFMPIARYFVTRSHFFMPDDRPAEMQSATGDFAMAMAQLGYTDPQIERFKLKSESKSEP